MDGKEELVTQDTPPAGTCNSLDAPELIKDDILADEACTQQNKKKIQQKESDNPAKNVIDKEKEQNIPQTGQIKLQVVFAGKKGEPNVEYKSESDINDRIKENSEQSQQTAGQKLQSNGEVKEEENKKNTNNKDSKKHLVQKERHKPSQNFVEIALEETNNNSDAEKDPERRNQEREKVRRARFSSEIRIEPKAYFKAGEDTVVPMPPKTLSDDVFQNETNHTSESSPQASSHVILNPKPSAQLSEPHCSVYPPTFLPLTLFSCLFCCPMIGLFAVYKSYSVNKLASRGSLIKAREASQHARQLGILTMVIGFFFVLAIIAIALLVSKLS